MKKNKTVLIFCAVFIIYLFASPYLPHTKLPDPEVNRQELHLEYEATYCYTLKNGSDGVFRMSLFEPSTGIPQSYLGTIEERAAKEIVLWAKQNDIDLPSDFQKDIKIATIKN